MLCLVRTKSCKRCGGDLSLESDRYGTYFECIQCGATSNEQEPPHTSAGKKSEEHQQKLIISGKH